MTNLQAKINNHQAAIDALRKQQTEENAVGNAVGKCYRGESRNCYYLTLPEDRYLAVHVEKSASISMNRRSAGTFAGAPEITFPEFIAAYKKRMSEIHMAATGEELFWTDEKVAKVIQTVVRAYDKNFGDDRVCQCGHTYIRHFDWGDEYRFGCKYCDCQKFVERTEAKVETPTPDQPAKDDAAEVAAAFAVNIGYGIVLNHPKVKPIDVGHCWLIWMERADDAEKFIRSAVAAIIRSERAKAYADGRRAGLKHAEEIASYQLLESRNQDEHAAIGEVLNKIREAGKK